VAAPAPRRLKMLKRENAEVKCSFIAKAGREVLDKIVAA